MTAELTNGTGKGELQPARASRDGWGWIASLGGRVPLKPVPPVSDAFVDGVLARLTANADAVSRRRGERLALLTGGCALAAALLLAAWSWPEISIVLGAPPPSVDAQVRVEPWL